MSIDSKRFVLVAMAGLAVAFVRQILQYQRYAWESWGLFFVSWFIHYVAIAIFIAITYACIMGWEKVFLGERAQHKTLSLDHFLVYISIAVIVAAICIFVLAHWVPVGDDDQ
jgi:hypothetical protein